MGRALKLSQFQDEEEVNLSDVLNLSDLEPPDPSSMFGPVVREPAAAPLPFAPAPTVQALGPAPEGMPELGSPTRVQSLSPTPAPIPAVDHTAEFQKMLAAAREPEELNLSEFADASDVLNLPESQHLADAAPGQGFIPEAQGIDYSHLTAADKAAALGKGALSGATMGLYQPQGMKPGTELWSGAGNLAGNLAAGAGITAASMGSVPLAMAGLGGAGMLSTATDLKARGMDPSDPAMMPLAAAGGALNTALPGSLGKSRSTNVLTGAGLGAGANVGQELAAAAATGTDPDVFTALALGGAMGAGAGLGARAGVPDGEGVPMGRGVEEVAPMAPEGPEINLSEVFPDDAVEARYSAQYEEGGGPDGQEEGQGRQALLREPKPVTPYTQGGDGGSLNEALYSGNVGVVVTDNVRDQLGLWHRQGAGIKRPWSLKEIEGQYPRIKWRLPKEGELKSDPFTSIREGANEGAYGLVLDGKRAEEIDEGDVINAIGMGVPEALVNKPRDQKFTRMDASESIPRISDEEDAAMEASFREDMGKAAAEDPDKVAAYDGKLYGEDGQELFDPSDRRNQSPRFNTDREWSRGLRAADNPELQPHVQVTRRLRGLVNKVDAGKMSPERMISEVARTVEELAVAQKAKRLRVTDRERGPDWIKERLLRARRHNELSHEAVEITSWMVDQNPRLVDELGISVRSPNEGNAGAAGLYNPVERVITLVSGRERPTTGLHEILHHTERMMPDDIRTGIMKEWSTQLARRIAKAQGPEREKLNAILRAADGDKQAQKTVMDQFQAGSISRELYQFAGPSEFWAENGTRIMERRYRNEGWVARAREWVRGLVEKVKGLVGLSSDAPVLKGLANILESDGQLIQRRQLQESHQASLRDLAPPPAGRPPQGGAVPPKQPGKPEELFPKSFDMEKEGKWDAYLRRVQDKFRPVKRVQRAIEKTGKKIGDETDTYLAETLYHGRAGDALAQAERKFTDPVIKAVKESGFDRNQVDDFLLARHAQEANEHIRKINPDPDRHFGMSDADAEAILKKAREDGTYDKLEAIGKQVDAAVNYGLDYAVREGIISEEQAANWRKYKHYVPAKGFAESDADDVGAVANARLGQGFDIRGREEKMRLGRKGRPDSPLANVFAQLSTRIVRAEKNRVGKTFLKMVLDNPNKDLWEVNKLTPQQSFDGSVVKQGYTLKKTDPNVVAVKVKGREYYITVKDERLAAAMKNMGEEKVGKLMQGLSKVNRYLAAVSTTYNPVFVGTNFLRDLQTAGINLTAEKGAKFTAKVYKDILPAMRGVLAGLKDRKTLVPEKGVSEWANWYKRFAKAGGKTEYLAFNTVDDLKKRFDAKLKPSALGKGMEPFKWLGEQVSDINGAVENAIRLSAFKNGVQSGMTDAQAAAMAKNLTVNFNRKGEIGSFMNAAYLFFNANLQGTHRILSVLAKPHTPAGKKLWGIAGTLVGSSVALTLWNRANAGEDEDGINRYDKLPPFVKERNLVFWFPGEEAPYTIPIPYGYNLLNVFGQTAVDLAKSTRDKDEVALNAMMAIFSAFNPLGTESSDKPATKGVVKLLSPTQLDPLTQLAVNEDFTGKPVKPEQLPLGTPKPESELYFRSVSPTAKWAAKKLNEATGGNEFVSGKVDISPEAMEHFVTAYTGGLGKFLYQSWDYAKNTVQGKETDVAKTPFIRQFKQGKNDYFDQREFVEKSGKYLQYSEADDKMGDEEGEGFRAKHADEIELGYQAREIKKELEKLSKEAREIKTDPDLTEEQKAAELEEIDAEKNALRREWNGARVKLKASKD